MTFDTHTTPTNGSESSNASPTDTPNYRATTPYVYKRLGDLFISAGNVRSTAPSHIPELAAMIDSQGLLSALQITAELNESGQPTGRSAIEAGGRRYLALLHLVDQGKATLNDLIECKEVRADKAKEVSLAENLGQEPMHPADEYAAFQSLVGEGKRITDIANAFGVEVLHVKRRLKLANVAPLLMDLYRKGELTLDQMMAFATVDDQERQVQTWTGLESYNRHPSQIKRKLAEDEIAQDDPRVKVIGLKNYLAAGGALKEDLFSGQAKPALVDLGLVELMVGEVMQGLVGSVHAEGWAWVKSLGEYTHTERQHYAELPRQYRQATADEAATRKALEVELLTRQDELDALEADDDADWDACRKVEQAIESIEAKQAAFEETLLDFSGFDKSQCGAVVALSDRGIIVLRGMVERSATEQASGRQDKMGGAVTKAERPEFPERLMKNLTSHRTAAVQAAMLMNQQVSLAALANTLALSIFDLYVRDSTLNVRITTCDDAMKTNSDTVKTSRAGVDMADAKELWLMVLPKEKTRWFAWFLEQPHQTVLDFIVYASALSTNLITGTDKVSAAGAQLSNALGLDMAQWWSATPATYFDLVPKSKLVAIVRETSTEDAAKALEKMKKDAAVAHTVKHTEGKNWLPAPLRVQAVPLAASMEEFEDAAGNDATDGDE